MLPLTAVSYAAVIALRSLWIAPFFGQVYGFDGVQRGNAALAMGAALSCGALAYGPVERWIGSPKRTTLVGSAIAAAALLALGLVSGLGAGAAVALYVVIGAAGMTYGILMAHARLFFPPHLLGRGVTNVVLALVIVGWAYYTRVARASALAEREREYIQAAQCLGLSSWRIMFRHLLPNCMPPLIVIASIEVASAIALEATLSFLGLGVPVTEPSLGLLISNGFQYMLSGEYWISFYPGMTLLIVIVAINLVGDRLRDILNPRWQK